MTAYIVRRLLYAVPILIGVNLLTFFLFFFVNTPDDMARAHLGVRRVTVEQIDKWKQERDYHLPYFHNTGWRQVAVRQVSGAAASLELTAQRSGDLRVRVEVPNPASGTLQVMATADSTASLSWDEEGIEVGLDEERHDLALKLQSRGDSAVHDLSLVLTPSEGAPQAIVRVYYKEDLGLTERLTGTLFWKKSVKFMLFQFGKSDDGRNIGDEILARIGPTLAITVPSFVIGVLVNITVAMMLAFFRGTYLDFWGVVTAVIMMSISILFYVIGGQWLFGMTLRLVPISGFDTGIHAIKFVALPVLIGIIGGIGTGVRLYRTFFLEETGRDYVRTARAKGLPESVVLFRHVLKNAMIPILTGVVLSIPFLIIGSLILESFYAIPGMGNFMLEAIQRQDFAIVQALVFLGSVLYIAGLLMTDISYTLVDPRIRIE